METTYTVGMQFRLVSTKPGDLAKIRDRVIQAIRKEVPEMELKFVGYPLKDGI